MIIDEMKVKWKKLSNKIKDDFIPYLCPSRDIARYTDKTKRKEEREDANDGFSSLSSSSLPLSESDEGDFHQ